MENREYKLSIDPTILELLGPSLYTNIYYVLAELIANAYDAEAHNVYIISSPNSIVVEDDGHGMSYSEGDITKYLNVAGISRTTEEETITPSLHRRRMGRKGVGKLAALSVSENVRVMTVKNGEKSGFILTRHPINGKLDPIPENQICLSEVKGDGTAIVMENPQYQLNKTPNVVKSNLLKLFPMVDGDFKIHIIANGKRIVLEEVDKAFASQLCALITLGEEFSYLAQLVPDEYPDIRQAVVDVRDSYKKNLSLTTTDNHKNNYLLEIKGWIGTYKSTTGRKLDLLDFPDNFLSLYAHKKMGEFNILPRVGENKLNEVYVVGQLHVDLFERSELPDMALSNRQGYKTDDPRYEAVVNYVKESLLPEILSKRARFAIRAKKEKEHNKLVKQKNQEIAFSEAVKGFKINTSEETAKRIKAIAPDASEQDIKTIVDATIESHISSLGIKTTIDEQKKKILISHAGPDNDLGNVIFKMLLYNNVPAEDIIYSSSEDEVSRIPDGENLYDYLRKFFVESYSDQKIYVIFITSEAMPKSWGGMLEIGAAWITQVDHKIFNIPPFRPEPPLDNASIWHTTQRENGTRALHMDRINWDSFCSKIEHICDAIGYPKRSRDENKQYLSQLVIID